MKKYIQPRTEEINLFTEPVLLANSPEETSMPTSPDTSSRNSSGSAGASNSGWTNKKDGGLFGSSNYWGDDE